MDEIKTVFDLACGSVSQLPLTPEDRVIRRQAQDELAAMARAEQLAAIDIRLAVLDRQAIRPLRALATGTPSAEDTATLAALEAEAQTLRDERGGLLAASAPD
ncbi:protein of unknown function [Magnetospirillum gryphiswaldense MSR-1 v2]|uniref:Uncharacterized protein n=1 Tax=Magnetospirillum gryphiswaldense (strain DSM 6361 / JCM 21280 / NBRC 15271 / MSR-1) TaxID=431944 RepID=V6F1Y3_MAGGM|nr:hypothetical protein [Magnetospirillum gryphiswaldense]CDK99464.1 protein of unknown function [Magnetospirillum gryphiswaldense MSR-1 v2]